jgi:hypothetical protein
MRKWVALAGAAAAALAFTPASATITSVVPKGGSTGVLIINNVCADEVDGPALTITGCLNTDHTSAGDVNFTSNENIKFKPGGGQAKVVPSDGATQTLTIDPLHFALDELILNIHSTVDGQAQFCDNIGCFASLFPLDGNGENFFTLTFDPAATLLTLNTFDALGAPAQLIEDTRQWRVIVCTTDCGGGGGGGGGGPPPVPEPDTIALLGAALLGFGLLGTMRRRRT